MFRKSVAADTGMIFPRRPAAVTKMWMKNTIVPLDMVFIGKNGTIRLIVHDAAPEKLTVISSQVPVGAVLELQGGIARKDKIVVGAKVVYHRLGGASRSNDH